MIHWNGKTWYSPASTEDDELVAVEWRNIREFPNYWVSMLGDVYNTKTRKYVGYNHHGGHGGTYTTVTLSDREHGVKQKNIELQRLMGWVFMEADYRLLKEQYPNERLEVDHINRDALDNRLHNLRWVTHRENIRNRGCMDGKTKEQETENYN